MSSLVTIHSPWSLSPARPAWVRLRTPALSPCCWSRRVPPSRSHWRPGQISKWGTQFLTSEQNHFSGHMYVSSSWGHVTVKSCILSLFSFLRKQKKNLWWVICLSKFCEPNCHVKPEFQSIRSLFNELYEEIMVDKIDSFQLLILGGSGGIKYSASIETVEGWH